MKDSFKGMVLGLRGRIWAVVSGVGGAGDDVEGGDEGRALNKGEFFSR